MKKSKTQLHMLWVVICYLAASMALAANVSAHESGMHESKKCSCHERICSVRIVKVKRPFL